MIAAPAIPSNRPGINSCAPWTHQSARPTQRCEVLGAGLLVAKAPLQLQQQQQLEYLKHTQQESQTMELLMLLLQTISGKLQQQQIWGEQ